jgi:hypothetical protein
MNLCGARRKFLFLAILTLSGAVSAAEPRVIDLDVVRGEPKGGVKTVRVSKGDPVTLGVTADVPLLVHIHGYEIELRTGAAGSGAKVRFDARITGRFPVTAHIPAADGKKHTERTLLYLEVHPK